MLNFKYLKPLGNDYATELSRPNSADRDAFLKFWDGILQQLIIQADKAKLARRQPQIAGNVPQWGAPGRVKALTAFHQQQQHNSKQTDDPESAAIIDIRNVPHPTGRLAIRLGKNLYEAQRGVRGLRHGPQKAGVHQAHGQRRRIQNIRWQVVRHIEVVHRILTQWGCHLRHER